MSPHRLSLSLLVAALLAHSSGAAPVSKVDLVDIRLNPGPAAPVNSTSLSLPLTAPLTSTLGEPPLLAPAPPLSLSAQVPAAALEFHPAFLPSALPGPWRDIDPTPPAQSDRDENIESSRSRSGRDFDNSRERPSSTSGAMAALLGRLFPDAASASRADEYQRRLAVEFDAAAADPEAGTSPSPLQAERVAEIVNFARTIRPRAAIVAGRNGDTLIVPFLADAEPVYLGLRALEGPSVDRSVKLAYINRLTLKTDREKLTQAWYTDKGDGTDSSAYNNWLRESEIYSSLTRETPVQDLKKITARFHPARGDYVVKFGGRTLGVVRETSAGATLFAFEPLPPTALSESGLALYRDGKAAGILLKPTPTELIVQQGLMVEARLDARLRAYGSHDPPKREQWEKTQNAFMRAFTTRLEAMLEQNPSSEFAVHALRLYKGMALPSRDALFVDTGFKGTIPVLFAALHQIQTGRKAGAYLYSSGRGFEEAVPALRIGSQHGMIESAFRFGALGGLSPEGTALLRPVMPLTYRRAHSQSAMIAREAATPVGPIPPVH
jgi:plasmid stabilization system protein ParE